MTEPALTPQLIKQQLNGAQTEWLDRRRGEELAAVMLGAPLRRDIHEELLKNGGSYADVWLHCAHLCRRWGLSDEQLTTLAHSQPEVRAHLDSIVDPLHFTWSLCYSPFADNVRLKVRAIARQTEPPSRDYVAEFKTWMTSFFV